MYHKIDTIIQSFSYEHIPAERKEILNQLITYIRLKKSIGETVRLNFICTHNSRRSHLSQIWAQTMAYHYSIDNIYCYSGGTEATAMFPKVAETLTNQGFEIYRLSDFPNPVYAVKYDQNEHPIICFSKEYNHGFNPQAGYAAIVTCNSADEACPVVLGADARFPIKYDDPKAFDDTDLMDAKYTDRSLQIGVEMAYVFGNV
jgi:arsenate reductase